MISLAVKYRPKTFEDVVGQVAIKEILQYQVDSKSNLNCYLFTGGAGTGKTTCARIFANELNGGQGLPIEIDAASNNGVEQVRKIIDEAKYKSLDSNFKIYILDECHMLSTGAWNAMLKLLEEPPAKTIFIMCTTDPQKIPATILSRVQRFDFQRIPTKFILERLGYILDEENKEDEIFTNVDLDALHYIAKLANGGMRDAITMLDKCIAYSSELTMQNVVSALGVVDYVEYFKLFNLSYLKEQADMIEQIESVFMAGKDLKLFIKGYFMFLVDIEAYNITKNSEIVQIPTNFLEDFAKEWNVDKLRFAHESMKIIQDLLQEIKWEQNPKPFIIARLLSL